MRRKCFTQLVFFSCMLLWCVFLCACSYGNPTDSEQRGEKAEAVSKDDSLQSFVANKYGIADSPLYGTRKTHISTSGGGKSYSYEEKLDDSANGGAIFYKIVDTENSPDNFVCAYISDDYQEDTVQLVINHYEDYKAQSGGISFPLIWERGGSRCYVAVVNELLVCVTMGEDTPLTADSTEEQDYQEEITVYDMASDFDSSDKLFSISRDLSYRNREFKTFIIEDGKESQKIRYSSGYDYYNPTEDELVTTQQEFCDRANQLLGEYSIDFISLDKTSWNNRWFGMSIDESSLGTDMVKVDFSLSDSGTDENGDEIQNLEIDINKEKEEPSEPREAVNDTPVDYGLDAEPADEEEKPAETIPADLPDSVDANGLQNISSFNIDGFWHSDDFKYVYHIYTKNPDNGFGTLYYADLEGEAEAKHGTVKQTSSYSVILKAMEDDGFSPEVYACNNQLVSDEITLIKAEDWIASTLPGTWSDDRKTYTFDNDGTYEVKTSDDWYWGQYFIINENQIVLGERLDALKVYDFSLEGNSFILGKRTFIRQ